MLVGSSGEDEGRSAAWSGKRPWPWNRREEEPAAAAFDLSRSRQSMKPRYRFSASREWSAVVLVPVWCELVVGRLKISHNQL